MAYNTRNIVKDGSAQPIPQYFNPTTDQYEVAQGSGGALNTVLMGNLLSAVVTLQSAAVAIGVGTALPTSGNGIASLAISGVFVGTVSFEGQGPDGAWYPINARQRGAGAIATTTTSGGLFEINCLGLTAVRANITAYTSGAITAKGQAQPLTPTSDTMQLTGSIVTDGVYSRGGALAGSTTEVIADVQTECELEYFTFSSSNAANVGFSIARRKSDGTYENLRWIDNAGALIVSINLTPDRVKTYNAAGFTLAVDAAGTYKINMDSARKFKFRYGVKIAITNGDVTSYNVAVSCHIIQNR